MDRAIHTAAAEQRAVRGIDDGVDIERGDVTDQKFDRCGTGFDGEERSGGHGRTL